MFCWYHGHAIWFFRLWGYGLHVQDMSRNDCFLFSERTGLKKTWRIGRYKIKTLAPPKYV